MKVPMTTGAAVRRCRRYVGSGASSAALSAKTAVRRERRTWAKVAHKILSGADPEELPVFAFNRANERDVI